RSAVAGTEQRLFRTNVAARCWVATQRRSQATTRKNREHHEKFWSCFRWSTDVMIRLATVLQLRRTMCATRRKPRASMVWRSWAGIILILIILHGPASLTANTPGRGTAILS